MKESIDTQQNKLIKQLQDNQLALTEGLDKNRLGITSGFDKMEEVKKWDLQQLPGYEAIEEPEEPEDDKPIFSFSSNDPYKITHRHLNKIIGEEIYPDDNEEETMPFRDIINIYKNSPIDKSRYKLMYDPDTQKIKLDDKKPKNTTVKYEKDEMDKYLNNRESIDLLNFMVSNFQVNIKTNVWKNYKKLLKKEWKRQPILKNLLKMSQNTKQILLQV